MGKNGKYANTFATEKALSKAERHAKRKLIAEPMAIKIIQKLMTENPANVKALEPPKYVETPVRPSIPIRPPDCPEPDPHADPWASKPMVEAMVGAVASVPMAFETVAPRSMPATVGVPWQGAEAEQHRQHDEYPHPLRPCSHGSHLSGITLS